jgi:tetratricopeptide (TPR) repeat protein
VNLLHAGLWTLLGLSLAGAFLPGRWLWGVNHLAYLPRWMTALWAFLAVAAVWPGAARRLVLPAAGRVHHFLFESRTGAFVVPLGSAAFFWLLRTRSFFLGDGHLLAELSVKGNFFHGFDDMDFALRSLIFRSVGASSLDAAFLVFQVVSVLSGALGIALAQQLLRGLSWKRSARTLAFVLLFTGGSVSLYFGYVEVYSFLFAFLTAFLLAGLLVLEGRISPWICSLFFALALLSHLTAVFSAPALLYLTLKGRGPWFRRIVRLWLLPAIPVILWVVIHVATGWDQDWVRKGFLRNEQARVLLIPFGGERGLFTLHRWKDLLNLALILGAVPLWIVLSEWRRIASRRLSAGEWLLLIQALTIGLVAVIIDPKLGAARDWDLLAAHAGGLALLSAAAWNSMERTGGSTSAVLASAVSVLLVAPWIVLQHMETRSAIRLAGLAVDFADFAKPYTYEELGMHFRLKEDYARAEQMYKACVESSPENPRFHINLGTVYAAQGKMDPAGREYLIAQRQLEQAVRADPLDTTSRRRLAQVLTWRGEHARAAALYADLARDEPNDEFLWEALAEESMQASDPARAVPAFERALALGGDPALRCDLGVALLDLDRFSEAAELFRGLVSQRGLELSARYGLAAALISGAKAELTAGRIPNPPDLDEAEEQLRHLLSADPGDTESADLARQLEALRRAGASSSGRH